MQYREPEIGDRVTLRKLSTKIGIIHSILKSKNQEDVYIIYGDGDSNHLIWSIRQGFDLVPNALQRLKRRLKIVLDKGIRF